MMNKRLRALVVSALSGMLMLAANVVGVAQQPAAGGGKPAESSAISFSTSEGTGLSFDVSPDGRWIVFDLLGQLWRIPMEGGEGIPLTHAVADAAEDLDPIVSPDGRWIAFQGDRNGVEGLWVIPTSGGAPRLLPGTEGSLRVLWKTLSRPAWSRDGRELAFLREDQLFVHRMERDSTRHVALQDQPSGILRCVDWLPDGRLLTLVLPPGRPGQTGAVLWLFEPESGTGRQVPTGRAVVSPGQYTLISACPASSPDGTRVAYFVQDDDGAAQLWVQPMFGGEPSRVTNQPDVLASRVRWTPNGEELLYAAGGRLWRVALAGGEPREIPFMARVTFQREEPTLPPLQFPDPGAELPARGHMGLALSPDGSRIALLALGRLWVWEVGAEPRAVTEIPITAAWPTWAPDGREVAWSGAVRDDEQIHVTDIGTGRTRRLTRLSGTAARPSWSPDGRRIAFLYRSPGTAVARFAVMPATADNVSDSSEVLLLSYAPLATLRALAQERLVWSPLSDALLYHHPDCAKFSCIYGGPSTDELRILPLEGDPIPLAALPDAATFALPDAATFLHWASDSSLIYVLGNQLWRVELRGRSVGEPVRLVEEPALYPSVARNGSILYVGPDGYRIRRPDGGVTSLGWPLTYGVPEAPPILIRGARIIDGTGAPPRGPSDVLLENGRIVQIAAAGSIRSGPGVEVVPADGRFLLPGLIDLHVHETTSRTSLALLYHGVTTVRNMGHPMAPIAAFAEAVEAGHFPGPRVVLGGVVINPGAPYPFTGADIQGTRDRQESERALLLARALGASFVKMQFPARWSAGAELVRQAHALGLRIGGHCAHALPLVAAGIGQVEHSGSACGPRSQAPPRADLIQLYRVAHVAVNTTFSVISGRIVRADTAWHQSPDVAPFLPPSFRPSPPPPPDDLSYTMRRRARAATGALHSAGVRIATGTDVSWPAAIHIELEDLVAAGLSPLEAIAAATSHAAQVLGAEHEIGTVAVGKHADLILLDADPLQDIRNTRKIWKVIQGGRIVDRDALIQRAQEHN